MGKSALAPGQANHRTGVDAMAEREIATGRLVVAMLLFLVTGAPIVLYVWWTVDNVFAGILQPLPIIVAIGLGCVFLIGAAVLAKYIRTHAAPDI